ncbi:MAG: hypothetical protein GXP42_17310, partial [Chloroflexi bacterium]|nr:hypothetical protein [Chloroflexota bacterium]
MAPLDERLDAAIDRLLAGESAPDDPALRPLLATASMLLEAPVPTPSRSQARRRMREALNAERARPRSFWDMVRNGLGRLSAPSPRQLAPAFVAMLLLILALGVVRSLPGQPLYPIKRGSEALALLFIRSPEAQADYYMRLADRRLSEMEALAAAQQPVTAEMVQQYHNTWALATSVPGAAPERLKAKALEQAGRLQMLAARLPSDARQAALVALDDIKRFIGIDELPPPALP